MKNNQSRVNKRRLPDDKFKGIKHRPDVKTYRLFVGIFPPESYITTYRNIIREYDKEKRNLRLIPMDQIHLTLKFIGAKVSENSKDLIADALSRYQGRFPRPEIKLKNVQFGFPHQYDPRVIMNTVESNDDLNKLVDMVHSIIRDLRLLDTIRWKEKNSNEFHLSLVRLKDSATRSSGKNISEITKRINFEVPESFVPEYIDLVESRMTRMGIVYRRLARIKL